MLEDYKGRWVVLYFYPRDNTPGCTLEAVEFTGLLPEFEKLGAVVVGVSPDSEESHRRFREKHGLGIALISDPEHTLAERFGVWKLKKNYGREYYGIERSTFILVPAGRVAAEWRKVKVRGHAEEVLARLRELVEMNHDPHI